MSNIAGKFVNPLTDFGFKKLFGSEPNKDLLIDLLNQILPPQHQISDLSYSKNEQVGQSEPDRKAIFDLYCTGPKGERFIVELQKAKQNYFKDRSIFYASFPIQDQAKTGDWDFKLAPIYAIGILDFVFEDHREDEAFVHLIELKNQRCEVFYDKLKFIYIELPKFKERKGPLDTQFDKWMYVLCYLAELQNRPLELQDRIFQKLFDAAEVAKLSTEERQAYETSLKYYRDLKNVVDTSREEGIEEGKELGLQEGKELGLQEGKELRTREIARMLKLSGVQAEVIAQSTGLSLAEIAQL